MIHLRIVVEPDRTDRVLELLERSSSVCNVVYLPGAARKPDGDVILADVAREDASVIISDLKASASTRTGRSRSSRALRRRAKHLDDPERRAAGLPTPTSRATTRSRPSS